jgi:hypothetical protein
MPGGPTPFGFAYFAGVKFAGYTCAAWALNRTYRSNENSIWKVGGARTALGLAAGAAYGGLFFLMVNRLHLLNDSDYTGVLYLGGLIPIRLLEWSLLIWYFYQRGSPNRVLLLLLRNSTLGIIWSFVLDAIGIYAVFVTPGGAWIC